MTACAAPANARPPGFTLLEVLVTLLLLSVGLLGIATLYLESLRAGRLALHQMQATTLAADLADRIRANRDPAGAYACGDPCQPSEAGNAIAVADLASWLSAVAAQLPGGTGEVTFAAATGATPARYTVAVHWTDGGAASPYSFQLRLEI